MKVRGRPGATQWNPGIEGLTGGSRVPRCELHPVYRTALDMRLHSNLHDQVTSRGFRPDSLPVIDSCAHLFDSQVVPQLGVLGVLGGYP